MSSEITKDNIDIWIESYKNGPYVICPKCGDWEYVEFDKIRKNIRDVWCNKCGCQWQEVFDVCQIIINVEGEIRKYNIKSDSQ
ncbi:MAG: hypothetical protein KatS3mg002_0397 [Candidatus Woesearchaeota archaeon]|nr:MAG: hypothetical protein KatS3mg002_0397 [Candidatus Woesearchaeota archaeon]